MTTQQSKRDKHEKRKAEKKPAQRRKRPRTEEEKKARLEQNEQAAKEKAEAKKARKAKQDANDAKRFAAAQRRDCMNIINHERAHELFNALQTPEEKKQFMTKFKALREIELDHPDTLIRQQASHCAANDPQATELIQAWKTFKAAAKKKEAQEQTPQETREEKAQQRHQQQQAPQHTQEEKAQQHTQHQTSTDVFRDEDRSIDEYSAELETSAPLSTQETFTLRIRLRPTSQQRAFLRNMFDAYRNTYNRCVTWKQNTPAWRERRRKQFGVDSVDLDKLAQYVLKERKEEQTDASLYNQRQAATREFQKTFRAVRKPGTMKTMHFKSAKEPRETICITSRGISFDRSGCRIWPEEMKKKCSGAGGDVIQLRAEGRAIPSKQWERLQKALQELSTTSRTNFRNPLFDCKITYDAGSRRYDVLVPMERVRQPLPLSQERVIALDPGVRTFLTGYCPSGSVVEFGPRDVEKLIELAHWSDKLQSEIKTEPNAKRRRRLRAARLRLLTRLRHLRDEMHWQLANHLCKNYDVILLPQLASRRMVMKQRKAEQAEQEENKTEKKDKKRKREQENHKKNEDTKKTSTPEEAKEQATKSNMSRRGQRRKISKDTVRKMALLSHYSFRCKLIAKAKQHGKLLLIVNEAFTSKTCTRCGQINHKLGRSKIFRCKKCGAVGDRDFFAARNILLRASKKTRTGLLRSSVPCPDVA